MVEGLAGQDLELAGLLAPVGSLESKVGFRGGGWGIRGKGVRRADYALQPKIPPRPLLADRPLLVEIVRQGRFLNDPIFAWEINCAFNIGFLVSNFGGCYNLHSDKVVFLLHFASNVCVTFLQMFSPTCSHFASLRPSPFSTWHLFPCMPVG